MTGSIDSLSELRSALVDQRRKIVLKNAQTGVRNRSVGTIERFLQVQDAIDAVDRALADEQGQTLGLVNEND